MSKIIKDCIYGHINIPAICVAFIDRPEFQRLRRIKQLGNVYRVYPSANHPRFEHSIGVMHLAGVMCDHLKIGGREKELIQLAGLYHDVGHMPYSHLFDKILSVIKPVGIETEHEERSIQTFRKVSAELNESTDKVLLTESEMQFVTDCIRGTVPSDGPKYLYQIISSEIDVDKLDYLSRDAYHTGMPTFQANYIILNSRIDPLTNNIVFRRKAFFDIKNMFDMRIRMHEEVYQHPVSLQYDTMYMCMIRKVKDKIDYVNLDDYKLETLLMTDPRTADIHRKLECRIKDHSVLCANTDCTIITKSIPNSGSIEEIRWTA